jgi:hypothetical protein
MNVNRGKRVQLSLDGYVGAAGFSEGDGTASVSFPASATLRLPVGTVIEADGRRWTVEKVAPSEFLRGFKVIDLRLAPEA